MSQPDDIVEGLNILIADDNSTDRMILKKIIQAEGHRASEAKNGKDAVSLFKNNVFDLVLLDAIMPEMDGFEAAKLIKELSAEDLVPIIFLTSLVDADSLADCLNAGGDDFLTKPYNRIVLKAKITAMTRLRTLNQTVASQRDRIAKYNNQLIREQEVAKNVFDNIAHPGCIDAPCIKYILSPMAVFNGDLLLAGKSPSGSLLVFLGDFTGHGLPAAIGAMPVAEIFYGMTLKGFAMSEILKEINKKLVHILPSGVFCCGSMLHLDFRKRVISIWNGGLPDVVLYQDDAKEIKLIPSFNLPLGILASDKFTASPKEFECAPNDRVFVSSDGILEEQNADGEMYGQERFLDVFANNTHPEELFNEHQQAINRFRSTKTQGDDHSLVEVIFNDEHSLGLEEQEVVSVGDDGPKDWRFSYELRSDTLRTFNPLPMLTHIIREVPGLSTKSGELYTILAELYFNALDHGVLALDSKLKSTSEGFAEYYRLKEARIQDVEGCFIKVTLEHKPFENGGTLFIKVVDSGKGFCYKDLDVDMSTNGGYCGRGLPLIETLCSSVRFSGNGNTVDVTYDWRTTNRDNDASA